MIDETGDRKKGETTNYVDCQYIGNLGKIGDGIVSVNADGIAGQFSFPLTFKVFQPKQQLKENDIYQTKLQLAQTIIAERVEFGFKTELVLADSLDGESHPFVGELDRLNLPWRYWNELKGWKQRLNHVQLLIQPFLYFCSIKSWLAVFDIPGLEHGLMSLIDPIQPVPRLAASPCSSALFLCLK